MLQVPAVVLATAPDSPSGRLSSTVTVRAVDGPALATVRVKVSGAPGTAGSGATVFTMESPALLLTGVLVVAVLFALSGSGVSDVTVAVLMTAGPAKSGTTVAVTVIVTVAPTARSPSEHVPPVQEPTPDVADSPVTPTGAGSA